MSTLQSVKGIILCDLDETILSPQKKLTASSEDFFRAIARAQHAGYAVGLCSDSAFETLARYARPFGMTGPLVVEMGAAYALSLDHPLVSVWSHPYTSQYFPRIRDLFHAALNLKALDTPYRILYGDANEIIENLDGLSGTDGDMLVAINGFRTYSLSFYVRARRQGRWTCDLFSQNAVEYVVKKIGELSDIWSAVVIDRNDAYGIYILHSRATSKTEGVRSLVQNFPNIPLAMIGNSISDRLKLPHVIQYGVANATEEYKATCAHTADRPFTEGVIELIDMIADHQS